MEENQLFEPRYYEIRIEGHLNETRAGNFGNLSMKLLPNGQTLISGPVPDQAALYGILIRIRDIGASLVSVISKPNN
jgi:hypothetical protein